MLRGLPDAGCICFSEPNKTVDTYDIVSAVGYLLGIEYRVFENENDPLQMKSYLELELKQPARRIRHLCRLRTALEKNYSAAYHEICFNMKHLRDLPDYIPQDSLDSLSQDGILIEKANCKPEQYIMNINGCIAQYINDCKQFFALWLNWKYIRELFIMPNGNTQKGLKKAAYQYRNCGSRYPYQVYLNWAGSLVDGNILYNDKKFITLLYQSHGEQFRDFSKVTDANTAIKTNVYDFLAQSGHVAIIVDCENADPYKVHAMLTSLGQEQLLEKVGRIILYNDVHASTAWNVLNQFTMIPIDHHMTERVKANKSLVDIELTTGVCREYYENGTDSFLLVSSDSDYWGLISTLTQARFLVMIEESKCSPAVKVAMEKNGVPYCCMDHFCTSGNSKLMVRALLGDLRKRVLETLAVDLPSLARQSCISVRADLSEAEQKSIYDRYIRPMRITFSENGEAMVQFGQ